LGLSITIDERLEFLVRSTESLHASTQELHAIVAEQTLQLAEHTRQLELDAQNIRSLGNIAAADQERLDDLESH
jgi:hypothetical protein